MSVSILTGDCRAVLATLPAGEFHTCISSPPYFGLRAYLPEGHPDKAKEVGTEPTPDEFVAALVAVFREVRRVLRDDGTVWLNLGDSYSGSATSGGVGTSNLNEPKTSFVQRAAKLPTKGGVGIKQKDLIGIPWMVAFALRADGWYLRSEIIWHKKNPMPESVQDRPTKAHEQIFLLSKRPSYYFDAKAIAEPAVRAGEFNNATEQHTEYAISRVIQVGETRNRRSVWTVATQPFAGSHFAVFPPALIEPCILAGCPERCCAACGAPWERVTETVKARPRSELRGKYADSDAAVKIGGGSSTIGLSNWHDGRNNAALKTLGFAPTCSCNAGTAPGRVIDPFGGAGTTGLVADRLQRNATLIELNPAYAAMARSRITDDAPLFVEAANA